MTDNPTTDVAVPEIHELVTVPTTPILQRLRAEAEAMKTAAYIARGLASGPLVPEQYQIAKHGDDAVAWLAAAIMYGAEIGLTAVQSANQVFIVKGRPAVYARTMAAQVRAAGYVIEPVEESDEKVVWKALRDDAWAYSEWTMARAEQAGYTSNAKYKSNPMEMLRAKAIAEVCRIKYQDVLLGMGMAVEELQLEEVTVTRPVARPPSARNGVAGLKAQISERAQVAEEAAVEIVDVPMPSPATTEQITEVVSALSREKIPVKERVGYASQIVCRDLTDLNDLTDVEAVEVLTVLATQHQPGAGSGGP